MLSGMNRSTRKLIIIMIILVAISVFISIVYYSSANSSTDPRVEGARRLYSQYNEYAKAGDFYRIFDLLNEIDSIYSSYPHYADSYEQGVILNNRGAALLTLALYRDSIRIDYNPFYDISVDSINKMAELYMIRAVTIYTDWKMRFDGMTVEEIRNEIIPDFFLDFNKLTADDSAKYLKSRAKEVFSSVAESDRRLSVCYTNLGVLSRQNGEYDAAVKYYSEALKCWDRNLSAENNLNALFGKPPRKRNILQKLFPPDRFD